MRMHLPYKKIQPPTAFHQKLRNILARDSKTAHAKIKPKLQNSTEHRFNLYYKVTKTQLATAFLRKVKNIFTGDYTHYISKYHIACQTET